VRKTGAHERSAQRNSKRPRKQIPAKVVLRASSARGCAGIRDSKTTSTHCMMTKWWFRLLRKFEVSIATVRQPGFQPLCSGCSWSCWKSITSLHATDVCSWPCFRTMDDDEFVGVPLPDDPLPGSAPAAVAAAPSVAPATPAAAAAQVIDATLSNPNTMMALTKVRGSEPNLSIWRHSPIVGLSVVRAGICISWVFW
jgi:hypothetical protein